MAGKDVGQLHASVAALSAIKNPMDQMAAVSRWITAKIDELAAADARIERRLEHMNKTEENLKVLFEGLRTQVSSGYPLLEELKQVEPRAKVLSQQVVADATAAARTLLADRLSALAEEQQSSLAGMQAQSVGALEAQAAEVGSVFCAQAERSAEELLGRVQASLNLADSALAAKSAELDLKFARLSQQTLIADAKSQSLAALVERVESRPTDPLECAKHMEREIGRQIETMQQTLDEYAGDFRRRCVRMIDDARRSATESVEAAGELARVEVAPHLDRIEHHRRSADAQLAATAQEIRREMYDRIDELKHAGESAVELYEQRMAERVLALKPQAIDAVSAAERSMRQRLDALLAKAAETMAERETELGSRIEQTRPRVFADLQKLEDDIRAQVAHLEDQSQSMTAHLERKLTDRIEARVRKLRQLVRTELTLSMPERFALGEPLPGIDDMSIEGEPPAEDSRVEVEVFVKNRNIHVA